jgi:ABC-2 type transport system permease protein
MSKTLVVARKEIKEILTSRTTLLLGLGFAIFFSITYSQGVIGKGGNGPAISLDGSIFYLSLAIALFMAYVATGQIFLTEKRDGVIETLMCAPLDLRQIWFGKTLAGVVPAYLVSILAALLLVTISSFRSGTALVPGMATVVHVLFDVPVFIAAFTGLVGFGQLLLGMRENRILNLILFAPAFAALYGSGYAVASGFTVSWQHVAVVLAGSLVLLGVATYLTRYLNRERIVTTIA